MNNRPFSIPTPLGFLFGILFCLGGLSAQNSIDSLQRLISAAENEEVRLVQSNALAQVLILEYPDSAFSLLKRIYQEAEHSSSPTQVGISLSLARVYEARQQVDSAILVHEQTITLAQRFRDKSNLAISLLEQAYLYNTKNDLRKGLELNKRALRVAKELGDDQVLFRVTNSLGRNYSFLAEFDSSSMYLQQALEIQNEKLGADPRMIFELHSNIGNNYGRSEQVELAIEEYEKGLAIMLSEQDSNGICISYRNIAVSHYFSGRFPAALEQLHKAVSLLEGSDFYDDQVINFDFLGDVYLTIEDYENAGLYWQKAIETWQIAHPDQDNPDLLFKKGRVLLLQEKYAEARDALEEAKQLKLDAEQYIVGNWYLNLGEAYRNLEQYVEAEENYRKAIEFAHIDRQNFTISESYLGLGQIKEKRQQYSQAKSFYLQAHENIANANGETNMKATAGLYRMFKQEGNTAEALRFLEESKVIQDSLFNKKTIQDITRMQADFEFEQEKQELAFAQAQELERESNIRRMLWGALVVAAILLFITGLYFRNKQKANEELSRLNTEIRQQKEKLEELDESKSRFFTNISHEFRTPLTIISGMIEKVLEKPEIHLERGAQMIRRNTRNLLNLVNQILELRKLESKELKINNQQGNIVAYLRYITESYSSLAEQAGLLLHYETNEEDIKMDYDAEKLLRVVSNLLSNAIKFTPHGGNVYFRINELAEQNAIQLEIEDTGVGIASENLPYIFDRFYQEDDSATRSGEGTGIGLSLSRELIQLMDGSLTVISEPEQGSTFTVLLPITNAAPMEEVSIDTTDLGIVQETANNQIIRAGDDRVDGQDRPKLLIVEDNIDVQQYLVAALEDYYDIDLAENGAIGIEKAIETIPDLIISDVMMPQKDGYELTATLKRDERTNHIPIILLTAKSDVDSKISGLEKGADAYLSKPFEERELFVRIDKLLELRKNLQERYTANLVASGTEETAVVIEDPFLQKLQTYIEEHLAEAELNMERLSKGMGMSRTQVFRKIKALTGKSPTLFIRSIRLKRGRHLLSSTNLTISEVAYEVGFTSLSYFSTAFMEEFGVRPSNFRK